MPLEEWPGREACDKSLSAISIDSRIRSADKFGLPRTLVDRTKAGERDGQGQVDNPGYSVPAPPDVDECRAIVRKTSKPRTYHRCAKIPGRPCTSPSFRYAVESSQSSSRSLPNFLGQGAQILLRFLNNHLTRLRLRRSDQLSSRESRTERNLSGSALP